MHICLLMHCNSPLWMVLKRWLFSSFSFIIHPLHNRYFWQFLRYHWDLNDFLRSGKLRRKPNDWRLRSYTTKNEHQTEIKSFLTWPAVFVAFQGEINNIQSPHVSEIILRRCFGSWSRLCEVSRPLKIFQPLQAPGLWDAMPSFWGNDHNFGPLASNPSTRPLSSEINQAEP